MTAYSSMTSPDPEHSATPLLRMFFLGLVIVSPAFLTGLNFSYTTVALPQMQLSLNDASWFGSVNNIGSPIGTLTVGLIIDRYGRKKALMFSLASNIFGWSLLYWNYNVVVVLLGQVLHGLANGAAIYPTQVYAGECIMINHIRLRNSFMMCIGLSAATGSTIMFILSTFLNYQQICALATVLSAILFVLLCFSIPESPSWLYYKGRIGDAEWSQKKLRISQPVLLRDESNDGIPVASTANLFQWSAFKRNIMKIKREDIYKPLIILTIFAVLQPFNGAVAIMVYMIDIMDHKIPGLNSTVDSGSVDSWNSNPIGEVFKNVTSGSGTSSSAETSQSYKYGVVSGILTIVANLVACLSMPYTGIKSIMIFCTLGTSAGMLLLFCTVVNEADQSVFYLHIIAVWLLGFLMSVVIGCPGALGGELFPRDAKKFASVPAVVGSVCTLLVIKLYPYLYIMFGPPLYCMYAAICICTAVYIYLYVPEVAGKTLNQINEEFFTNDTQSDM